LNQLILDLLSKDPAARPASALDVEARLERAHSPESSLDNLAYESDELRILDRIVRGRMVGRKREVSELKELWTRAVAGDLAILFVSGEPGIGKSRLVRELATWVEAAGGGVLRGDCFEDGGMPYGPFVQVLEESLGRGRTPALDLPSAVIADLVAVAPSLQQVIPGVEANPPLDSLSEQHRIYESILRFLLNAGQNGPILFVIEDLHWADNSTLSLLRHLVRRAHGQPICFVATYREAEIEGESPLFGLLADLNRQRLSKRIKLSRLDRTETGELLQTILGESVSSGILDTVFYETEGNPFFIEEVCKSLVEEGKLYQIDGKWNRVDTQEIVVPQSLRLVVQSRLRKVTPETREILQLGAVLGRDFNLELLVRATGLAEGRAARGIEEAEAAQLILLQKTGEGLQISFAHALIPGTLREEVTGVRRARLHRQVAQALEALRPNDFAALAYHYSEAGDERRARRYFVRSANRAREVYAHEEALSAYSKALDLSKDDLTDQYDLLAARIKIFDLTAERDQQLSDARRMVELAQTLEDAQRECDAYLYLTDVYLVTDHSKARLPAEKAIALARSMDDLYREGQALRRLGDQAHRSYDYPRSRTLLETAAARFRKTGFSAEAASCLSILSVVLSRLGENESAVRSAEEAVELSQAAGDRRGEGTSLRRLGISFLDQSKFHEAEVQLRSALAIHREIGDRSEECNDLNVLGVVQAKQRMTGDSRESFALSLEIADQIGSVTAILYAINNRVLFQYRLQGELEAGIYFLQTWLMKGQDYDDEFMVGSILLRMAELFAAAGAYSDAMSALGKVEPIASRLMGAQIQVSILSQRGLWKVLNGEQGDGMGDISQALSQARGLGSSSLIEAVPLVCWASAVAWRSSRNELPNAVRRAEQALDLLRGSSGSWVDVLGKALAASARLHLLLSQGNDVAASKALSRASELVQLAEVSPEASAPNEFLLAYALALRAAGREEEASPYLRDAYDWLIQVAGRLEDPDLKRSWLEAVPENREILSIWESSNSAQDESGSAWPGS
jgi:tetratricopeptide (TPR) repeat protein